MYYLSVLLLPELKFTDVYNVILEIYLLSFQIVIVIYECLSAFV